MFNDVKIYDGAGQLKKVITGKSLSKKYWEENSNVGVEGLSQKAKARARARAKKVLNVLFVDEKEERNE